MSSPQPHLADKVAGLSAQLLACLCVRLESGAPYTPVCRCCRYTGQELPPADVCASDGGCCGPGENGQAWSQVVTIGEQLDSVTGAPTALRVVSLRLGVYRCLSAVLEEDGTVPACEASEADADLVQRDAFALRMAVLCCEPIVRGEWVLQAPSGLVWSALQTQGNCGGGMVTVTVVEGLE